MSKPDLDFLSSEEREQNMSLLKQHRRGRTTMLHTALRVRGWTCRRSLAAARSMPER